MIRYDLGKTATCLEMKPTQKEGARGDKGTECLASTLYPASDMDNYTSFLLHVNFHIWCRGSGVGCMGAGMISQLC